MRYAVLILIAVIISSPSRAQTEKYAVVNSLIKSARIHYKPVDSTVLSATPLPLFRRPEDTAKIYAVLHKALGINREQFDVAVSNADEKKLNISQFEKVDRIATSFSYPVDMVMTTYRGKKKIKTVHKAPKVLFCSISPFIHFPGSNAYLVRFSAATGSTYGGACYHLVQNNKGVWKEVDTFECIAY